MKMAKEDWIRRKQVRKANNRREQSFKLQRREADWVKGGKENDWPTVMMSILSLTAWQRGSGVKNRVAAWTPRKIKQISSLLNKCINFINDLKKKLFWTLFRLVIISNKYSKNLGEMDVMSTITERMEKKEKERKKETNSASDRKRKGTFSNVFIGSYTTVPFVWPIWDQIGLFVSRELKRDQHFFPKQTNKRGGGLQESQTKTLGSFYSSVQARRRAIIEPIISSDQMWRQ